MIRSTLKVLFSDVDLPVVRCAGTNLEIPRNLLMHKSGDVYRLLKFVVG